MKEKYINIKCPITDQELTILCGIKKINKKNIKNKITKLFLHGVRSNIDSWKDILNKINGPLLFINMVGNGYSSSIPDVILDKTNIELLDYFNIIINEVLKYFEIDKNNLHIIGHSFGGFVATHYAKNNTCSELSLICPYGMFEISNSVGHIFALLFNYGIIDYFYQIKNYFNDKMKYKANIFVHKFVTLENYILKSFCNITFFDFITTTEIPINLIYGYHDLIVPLHQGLVIHNIRLKNNLKSKLNIILHTGHDGLSLDKIHKEDEYKLSFDIVKNSKMSTSIYKEHLKNHYEYQDLKTFCDETHIYRLFNKKIAKKN